MKKENSRFGLRMSTLSLAQDPAPRSLEIRLSTLVHAAHPKVRAPHTRTLLPDTHSDTELHYTRTLSSGSVRLPRVCQHFTMLGYSASLSPDSQASDPSSRLVFIEGRTLVKFMIRAPDPRPPLAISTVLLLPHELLFTSRSSNTASSKSRSNLSATTQKHPDP